MIRLVQISDTHFCASNRAGEDTWRATVEHIRHLNPALVIHTGDVVHDDPANIADRVYAAEELSKLGIEILAVPGNHDIGDGPPVARCRDKSLLEAFHNTYGVGHWSRDIGFWRLIGVNAMLFGHQDECENLQWNWLEKELESIASDRHAILFLHKPPFLVGLNEDNAKSAAIPQESRQRFWGLIKQSRVRLVACGHRHEYRVVVQDGIPVVWAPTTSDLLDEYTPPMLAQSAPGFIEYVLVNANIIHRVLPLARDPRHD